jgi:hypothetical protein
MADNLQFHSLGSLTNKIDRRSPKKAMLLKTIIIAAVSSSKRSQVKTVTNMRHAIMT